MRRLLFAALGLLCLSAAHAQQGSPTNNPGAAGGGSGTVTSIAPAADNCLTLTPNPIVATGTIGPTGALASGACGGTGVANTGKTITLGGNLTTSGAFAATLTLTNTTSITLPTAGTLAILGANSFTGLQTLTAGASISSGQNLDWNSDLILARNGAADLRLGGPDAAAPVIQHLSIQSVVAGTSNTNGISLEVDVGKGTGTGTGGAFDVNVSQAGTTGTAQNALVRAMRVGSDGSWIGGNFTLTAGSNPALQINQTWNNAGQTYKGAVFNFTCTACNAASLLLDLQLATVSTFNVAKVGQVLINGTSGLSVGYFAKLTGDTQDRIELFMDGANNPLLDFGPGNAAPDVIIRRDAAAILADRNGANAQTFRVYNTFTDASNGEWGEINWITNANVLTIGTKANGTGTTRNMEFEIGGTNQMDFGVTTAALWTSAAPFAAKYTQSKTVYSAAGTAIPACAAGLEGSHASVSDATAPTYGSTYTSGGAVHSTVYCNGTNWIHSG